MRYETNSAASRLGVRDTREAADGATGKGRQKAALDRANTAEGAIPHGSKHGWNGTDILFVC